MANPLPDEARLYQTIKDKHLQVSKEVWDLIYHRVGDCLTAINLMCEYYLDLNQPMPIEEAKKILNYIRRIKEIIGQITKRVSPADQPFPEFKPNSALDPVINEMFMHYIPNDTNIMGLIISDTIDPADPRPIPAEYLEKILGYSRCSMDFMERLRAATLK